MGMKIRVKRIVLGLMAVVLIFSLSACGSRGSSSGDSRQQSQADKPGFAAKSTGGQTPLEVQSDKVVKAEQLEKEEQVLVYLEKTVPEIEEFGRNIEDYNKESNTNCRLIVRIDGVPDSLAADTLARDYYCIYVGSDMGTHTSRWNSFYVKQDLSTVLLENLTGEAPLTVEQWRQLGEEPPAD